jgi:hypothetical protein
MMTIGEKIVCVDAPYGASFGLKEGEIYSIKECLYGIQYSLNEIDGVWNTDRFRSLEEMQNTNFISIAKKE